MAFNSFRAQIIVRLGALIATIFILANVSDGANNFFLMLFVAAIGVQVYYLFNFLDRSNREVINFLKSIRYEDFSHTYPENKSNSSLGELTKEFNEVIKKFREIRAEKEAQHQYLKTIVQHVGIGIITFDKQGEVQIINTAARKLLEIPQLKNISQLNSRHPALVNSIKELRTGGREMVKIIKDEDEFQLAVYAIELSLRGKEFKLISLQNIQSELEEKEMEAWQNLIRVLTHEIMNSVTPISSLAAIVESELQEMMSKDNESIAINRETAEDFYLSVKTIHNRSASLINFVGDFRNMTRIRHPMITNVGVNSMIDHILQLLRHEIEANNIGISIDINPENLHLQIDREQIEQVLINLVKNAIQALNENEEVGKESKIIKLKAWQNQDKNSFLSIEDNGTGIDEEAQKKIFIPFYTTKKNGSGIGLSLSKQIMRQHNGSISVKSVINAGTEFTLKFNN